MREYERLVETASSFRKLLMDNRTYGTADSEVYHVFKDILRRAMKGGDPYVPMSREGWQLYDLPGSHMVAQQLHAAAVAAVDALKTCPIRYARQVGDFVNGL